MAALRNKLRCDIAGAFAGNKDEIVSFHNLWPKLLVCCTNGKAIPNLRRGTVFIKIPAVEIKIGVEGQVYISCGDDITCDAFFGHKNAIARACRIHKENVINQFKVRCDDNIHGLVNRNGRAKAKFGFNAINRHPPTGKFVIGFFRDFWLKERFTVFDDLCVYDLFTIFEDIRVGRRKRVENIA